MRKAKLRQRTRDMAASLLALGLDPERCTLFVQSHRPEHTELAWLLSTVTPVSWLERTPTYKEKRQTRYYISAKTLHVLWLQYEEPPATGGPPVKYTRKFFDYRYAQQTLVAYRSMLMEGDKQVQEVRIFSVTYGGKQEDSVNDG